MRGFGELSNYGSDIGSLPSVLHKEKHGQLETSLNPLKFDAFRVILG
jgi:hypothetical protein